MLLTAQGCAGPLLRAAVILVTLLSFLYSLGISFVLWKIVALITQVESLAIQQHRPSPLSRGTHKLGLYPVSFMWTVLCFVSLIGFVGSSFKNRTIFSKYVTLIWSHFVIDLVVGCFSIWIIFKNKDWSWFLKLCLTKTAEYRLDSGPCRAPLSTLRGIYIGLFFGGKALGFGMCWMASTFLYHLRAESAKKLPIDHPLRKMYAGGSSPSATQNLEAQTSQASLTSKHLPIEYHGPPSPNVRKPPVSRTSSARSGILQGDSRRQSHRQEVLDIRADYALPTPSTPFNRDQTPSHEYPPSRTPHSAASLQAPILIFSSPSPVHSGSVTRSESIREQYTESIASISPTDRDEDRPSPTLASTRLSRYQDDDEDYVCPPAYISYEGYVNHLQPRTMFDKNIPQKEPSRLKLVI